MIHAAVAGVTLLVFLLDAFTPLGYAEWIFYFIPVALCIFQSNRQLPLIMLAVLMPLMLLGYHLSPHGIKETVAIFNRAMAFVVVAGVAYLARAVITERVRAQHLIWLERGRSEVSRNMLGELSLEQVSEKLLQALVRYLDAQVAVLYRIDEERLACVASFGLAEPCADRTLAAGGLPGEVAKSGNPVVVSDLPAGYLRVSSATSAGAAAQVVIVPVLGGGMVTGVMEFGFLRKGAMDAESELLQMVATAIGSALKSAEYRENLKLLLEQTQHQAEELQTQQEELRVTNEELEEQSRALMESQAMLENQQAELEQTNLQLVGQTEQLEAQADHLREAKEELERNATELGRANQYKSEFLANMSHELRTPLNSSLILSKILMDNKKGLLDEEQVRYARTIYSSNNELLALINDILDLSKIESGHADVHPEPVAIASVVASLRDMFEQVAKEKSLAFKVAVSSDAPASIVTDRQRLQQILKNLLSNAFKFTSKGEVTLEVARAPGERLTIAVRDTGIGIPEQQQAVIFEAFRQADGTTSRKFGGTGLGLSISRELARLLGGAIHVHSAPGVGSTFTLEIGLALEGQPEAAAAPAAPLPYAAQAARSWAAAPAAPQPVSAAIVPDDRAQRSRERLILVIEDDQHFAAILYDLAHELNFDCVIATSGADAVRLAREFAPSGILLDVGLPDQSGLTVLEELKRDPRTRHIPIHMISVEDHVQKALEMGAVGYAFKPVAREELVDAVSKLEQRLQHRARKVLVVEDDSTLRENLALLLAADDIEITTAGTAGEALSLVSGKTFDCVVLDLNLPDSSGYELLEKMAGGGRYSFPPVIVYTGRVVTPEEERQLRRYSRSIIIKGARSPERLVDEVTLFLHRVESSIPPDQQKLLQQARQRDAGFEGRRILLVEDDVRNIFALTSVFEPLGAELKIARNGLEALKALEQDAEVDLVLMDLMMPEMDGLTAIREIRRDPAKARLPIIALTAKAMSDDRRSCMEAGANDYIAKPIDVDKLLTLCRVWMPRK